MSIVKTKSSIIIFGNTHEYVDEINNTLRDNFSFYQIHDAKDVHKFSENYEKIALIFSDIKSCIHFLQNCVTEKLVNFSLYLVMDRNGKFKEQTEEALKSAGVRIFMPSLFQDLISDLKGQGQSISKT